ncbi:nucleotide-binding protein [Candidatus Woesearchaeota archaeon]|nr:nucleotide-binding protein [Candidatus Woesearchaeota archaeon]
MIRIILDTNFLLIPLQFRVDIFSEFNRICKFNYELYIFEQSICELSNIIEEQSGLNKKAARFALKLIKLKNIKIIKSEKIDVDLLILDSINKDVIIATQDAELKKELLKKGASLIILRQKKYLHLIERKLYK